MATGRTRINQENFKLITKGMSKKEVSQILAARGLWRGFGDDHRQHWQPTRSRRLPPSRP
jgi:hypothetical protein